MIKTVRWSESVVTVACIGGCNRAFEIPLSVKQEQKWRAGALIQIAAPELTEELRELLISGYCGRCFDALCDDR